MDNKEDTSQNPPFDFAEMPQDKGGEFRSHQQIAQGREMRREMFQEMFPKTFGKIIEELKDQEKVDRAIDALTTMNQQANFEGGASLDGDKWINNYGMTERGKQLVRNFIDEQISPKNK